MAVTWKKLAYEADVVTKALFNANTILASDGDNSPAALEIAEQRILGRITSGNIVGLTAAQVLTLISVTSGADVTGDNAPQAHKDSHDPDGSDPLDCAAPAELADVQAAGEGSASTFARADHAHQIQHDITDNHIVTVDGSPTQNEIALWGAGGLDGATPAAVAASMALDDVGVPDAGVDFDLQEATDLVVFTVANETTRDGLSAAATEVGQLCWATSEGTLAICTASS